MQTHLFCVSYCDPPLYHVGTPPPFKDREPYVVLGFLSNSFTSPFMLTEVWGPLDLGHLRQTRVTVASPLCCLPLLKLVPKPVASISFLSVVVIKHHDQENLEKSLSFRFDLTVEWRHQAAGTRGQG